MAQATYDDANLILRLFELRREEKMRKAREWFGLKFNVNTFDEAMALCPPGSEENTYYRMVVSYWDMVASFVTSGVLNEDLFFENSRELLFVWEKIRAIVPGFRERMKDPQALKHLETVGEQYVKWMKRRGPEAYETWQGLVKSLPQEVAKRAGGR